MVEAGFAGPCFDAAGLRPQAGSPASRLPNLFSPGVASVDQTLTGLVDELLRRRRVSEDRTRQSSYFGRLRDAPGERRRG